MHSHLIPGIDDGSKTIEDSVMMILSLQKLGYEKNIATPTSWESTIRILLRLFEMD